MRKSATAVIAAAFALAAAAQQPQQCVNPQMLNGLVFLGRSDLKVSVTPGQPAFMSGLSVPTDLLLIGTGVLEGGMTTVAYKTSRASDKAYAAVVTALGAEGWAVEQTAGSSANFNVAGGLKQGTLCRNTERRYVTVTDIAGARYVNIVALAEARRRECNVDPFMSTALSMGPGGGPWFQFPAGTSLAQGFGAGGGSNTMYTTGSRIISEETPASLVEHLASQLEDQGWQPDSGWSGSGSAGSTWRKTQDGELTWGTLEIIRVSEATYDVDFTMALPQ
ncbi:MAG TPA: hypothetical protein VMK82_04170 [Steroidobacteraceae bacterium]|nr:hypothetical protein [Steroidobacteraceae bacterium]